MHHPDMECVATEVEVIVDNSIIHCPEVAESPRPNTQKEEQRRSNTRKGAKPWRPKRKQRQKHQSSQQVVAGEADVAWVFLAIFVILNVGAGVIMLADAGSIMHFFEDGSRMLHQMLLPVFFFFGGVLLVMWTAFFLCADLRLAGHFVHSFRNQQPQILSHLAFVLLLISILFGIKAKDLQAASPAVVGCFAMIGVYLLFGAFAFRCFPPERSKHPVHTDEASSVAAAAFLRLATQAIFRGPTFIVVALCSSLVCLLSCIVFGFGAVTIMDSRSSGWIITGIRLLVCLASYIWNIAIIIGFARLALANQAASLYGHVHAISIRTGTTELFSLETMTTISADALRMIFSTGGRLKRCALVFAVGLNEDLNAGIKYVSGQLTKHVIASVELGISQEIFTRPSRYAAEALQGVWKSLMALYICEWSVYVLIMGMEDSLKQNILSLLAKLFVASATFTCVRLSIASVVDTLIVLNAAVSNQQRDVEQGSSDSSHHEDVDRMMWSQGAGVSCWEAALALRIPDIDQDYWNVERMLQSRQLAAWQHR